MTNQQAGPLQGWTRRSFIRAGLAGSATLASIRWGFAEETPMPQKFATSSDGTQIAYDQAGSGPALVLVGGALSQRADWAPIARLLSASFTVMSIDRRGRGHSGDAASYGADREIEDIAAVIGAAGGTAFVHGQSSGAVLCLRLADRHPDKVSKLSVYEPPLILDDSRPPAPVDASQRIAEFVGANKRDEAVSYWMTDVVGAPAEAVEAMKTAPTWPDLEALAHTLPYDLALVGDLMSGRPLPAGIWGEATMPILVMSGGASQEWVQASAKTLANTLPLAEHRTLEGQTHNAAPEVLAPVIERFFLG